MRNARQETSLSSRSMQPEKELTMKSAWMNSTALFVGLLISGCTLRMSEFTQTPHRQPYGTGMSTATMPVAAEPGFQPGQSAPIAPPAGAVTAPAYTPPTLPEAQPVPQAQTLPETQPTPQAQPPVQSSPPTQPTQATETAETHLQPSLADIKALARSGFSDDVILNTIRSSGATYSLSSDEISDLKSAGVSAKVIDFMVNPATQPSPSPAIAPPPVVPAPVVAPPAVPIPVIPPPAVTPAAVPTPAAVAPSGARSAPATASSDGALPQPPPPIDEEISPPRGVGYVWMPGAWTWHKGRWLWIKGQWVMPPRPGSVWVPGQWEIRRGKGVWITGHWR